MVCPAKCNSQFALEMAHELVLPMQVMQKSTPIDHGLVALSSFGFGGANMHMVMQSYSGDRMQLLSSDSSSEDSLPLDSGPTDNIIPLASRTADGLAYLAKIVNEVSFLLGTTPQNVQTCLLCELSPDGCFWQSFNADVNFEGYLIFFAPVDGLAKAESSCHDLELAFHTNHHLHLQAEAADGISFAQPLRRYANTVAEDIKLSHRGTLVNGELKAGAAFGKVPEVNSAASPILFGLITQSKGFTIY